MSSKRQNISRIASAATTGHVLPLSVLTVETVAAALKAAGLKSGTAYLAELRLLHVEAGWEIPSQLARGFDQARRSLDRGKGPPCKAAEFRFEQMLAPNDVPEDPVAFSARASYVVAQRWRLREIELANLDMDDVWFESVDERGSATERAALSLPVSKSDTHGAGAVRKLGHTCSTPATNPLAGMEKATCPCALYGHIWKNCVTNSATIGPVQYSPTYGVSGCPRQTRSPRGSC